MTDLPRKTFLSILGTLAFGATAFGAGSAADSGTRVLKWMDGKKAAFLLAFDDGAPTQLKNVIPELEKRKIVGTFYLVTGNTLYAGLKAKWEEAAKSPYVEIANHTFTHKGVKNVEELDVELAKNTEVIYKLRPERKQPRLLGFGKPGGVPWEVTEEEVKASLAKHNLADRPPFQGPPIHHKSVEAVIAAVDRALEKGEMGHLDFHGVGGDWLSTPMEWFLPLLDKLESSSEDLWITDVVSWHQYVTERNGAKVKELANGKDGIRVELTTTADPKFYDLPLTLETKVPADWTDCTITQGDAKRAVVPKKPKNGVVRYYALPGGGEITIKPGR